MAKRYKKYQMVGIEAIPQYAIPYIEYGEADNLTDDDIENIDDFLDGYTKYAPLSFEYRGDAEFRHTPAFGLPAECVITHIHGVK